MFTIDVPISNRNNGIFLFLPNLEVKKHKIQTHVIN